MKPLVLALALGALLSAPASAPAIVVDVSPFSDLQSELTSRRDKDYGGDLTRAQEKELAAIEKALAILDLGPAEPLVRVKAAMKAEKTLVKPFPEIGMLQGGLDDYFIESFNNLTTGLENRRSELAGLLGSLSEKAAAKVQKALDRAQAQLDIINDLQGPDYAVWGRALTAGNKAVQQGEKAAAKELGH